MWFYKAPTHSEFIACPACEGGKQRPCIGPINKQPCYLTAVVREPQAKSHVSVSMEITVSALVI